MQKDRYGVKFFTVQELSEKTGLSRQAIYYRSESSPQMFGLKKFRLPTGGVYFGITLKEYDWFWKKGAKLRAGRRPKHGKIRYRKNTVSS